MKHVMVSGHCLVGRANCFVNPGVRWHDGFVCARLVEADCLTQLAESSVTKLSRHAIDVSLFPSPSHVLSGSLTPFGFDGLGTTTGRICDGYDPVRANSEPKFIAVVPSPVRQEESRSLLYFHEKTLAQMSTFFPDEFWTRQLLQVASSDRCIRHSILALSSYHELFSTPQQVNGCQFALRHYNLSIKGILGSPRTAENAHIYLMSCIMFICIEVWSLCLDQGRIN